MKAYGFKSYHKVANTMNVLGSLSLALLVIGLCMAEDENDKSSGDLSPGAQERQKMSSFSRRLKTAGRHAAFAVYDSMTYGPGGIFFLAQRGIVGAKDEAVKVKKCMKHGQYDKALGHGALVAARPLAAVIATPVPVAVGATSLVVGATHALGNLAKAGQDGVKKVFNGRESREARHTRHLKNLHKYDDDKVKQTDMYDGIGELEFKVGRLISGRKEWYH